jgi:hypothetical protein
MTHEGATQFAPGVVVVSSEMVFPHLSGCSNFHRRAFWSDVIAWVVGTTGETAQTGRIIAELRAAACAGAAEAVPPMTTSSLRLAKWLAEYATLMRLIRSEVR